MINFTSFIILNFNDYDFEEDGTLILGQRAWKSLRVVAKGETAVSTWWCVDGGNGQYFLIKSYILEIVKRDFNIIAEMVRQFDFIPYAEVVYIESLDLYMIAREWYPFTLLSDLPFDSATRIYILKQIKIQVTALAERAFITVAELKPSGVLLDARAKVFLDDITTRLIYAHCALHNKLVKDEGIKRGAGAQSYSTAEWSWLEKILLN